MNTTGIRGLAVALAAAALFNVSTASADFLSVTSFADGSIPVTLTNTPMPPAATSGLAGGLLISDTTTGASFEAWCVDIFHTFHNGNYTLVSPLVVAASPRAQAVSIFASNHLGSVVDATTSGAFQMAIWEIVNETIAPLNVNVGTFTVDGGPAADALANAWLANNPLGNTLSLDLYASTDTPQSQWIVVFHSPIPEPNRYAMMLVGFGLAGLVAIRRKRWNIAT
jgi:hypothetical protein